MPALLALIFVWFSAPAGATMYLAAFEPSTGETGMIYSSSGGNFWQTMIKNKGLLGEQNYGLCGQATPRKFLEQGLTAGEVVRRLVAQCAAVDWHAYRLLVITSNGEIDYAIGRDGCSIPDCGARRAPNVVVTGGGLQDGVLDQALAIFQEQSRSQSFTCRLYNTLARIYRAGGEIKEFKGASITVDHPGKAELLHAQADIFGGGGQQDLLLSLKAQLKKNGEDCFTVPH